MSGVSFTFATTMAREDGRGASAFVPVYEASARPTQTSAHALSPIVQSDMLKPLILPIFTRLAATPPPRRPRDSATPPGWF